MNYYDKVYKFIGIFNHDNTPKEDFSDLLGESMEIHFLMEGKGAVLPIVSKRNQSIITTKVSEIIENGDELVFKTKNSIYKLKKENSE